MTFDAFAEMAQRREVRALAGPIGSKLGPTCINGEKLDDRERRGVIEGAGANTGSVDGWYQSHCS